MKAAHPEVVAATRVNPGETLRQARESNGWSLAEVALKLNLTVASLGNLEAGAFDKLPGHTFARGYIRAYAKRARPIRWTYTDPQRRITTKRITGTSH